MNNRTKRIPMANFRKLSVELATVLDGMKYGIIRLSEKNPFRSETNDCILIAVSVSWDDEDLFIDCKRHSEDVDLISTIISESYRRGDVAVIFCELKKEGEIKSLSKGVFYKPEMSSFGLGELPLDKEEIVKFFSKKLDAHISGQYGYNMLGLTEQNAQTITLAGKHPFKEFSVQNCRFNYMKSEVGYVEKNELSLAILLDALNYIESISGKTGSEVFQILKGKIERMHDSERNKLIKMGKNYPIGTKDLLSKLLLSPVISNTKRNR